MKYDRNDDFLTLQLSSSSQAMGIKMVLSGEGADEIFAGYLYFHKCPNPEEMQAELKDKIR